MAAERRKAIHDQVRSVCYTVLIPKSCKTLRNEINAVKSELEFA